MSKWAALWLMCAGYGVGLVSAQEVRTGSNGLFQAPAVAVASLPVCNAGLEGVIYVATNALTPVALTAVVGGGSVHVGVMCLNSAWIVL
jgi:hypothetical protein